MLSTALPSDLELLPDGSTALFPSPLGGTALDVRSSYDDEEDDEDEDDDDEEYGDDDDPAYEDEDEDEDDDYDEEANGDDDDFDDDFIFDS